VDKDDGTRASSHFRPQNTSSKRLSSTIMMDGSGTKRSDAWRVDNC
jgi:hypothetical protein